MKMMTTNRLVNVCVRCVKMLQSLVSWFDSSLGHISDEGCECFLCAFVYVCSPTTATSLQAVQGCITYQTWMASREGYVVFSYKAEKIAFKFTSSCTGTADQIKSIRARTHHTENKKYVLSVDFCHQIVPGILFASSSYVFCDMA